MLTYQSIYIAVHLHPIKLSKEYIVFHLCHFVLSIHLHCFHFYVVADLTATVTSCENSRLETLVEDHVDKAIYSRIYKHKERSKVIHTKNQVAKIIKKEPNYFHEDVKELGDKENNHDGEESSSNVIISACVSLRRAVSGRSCSLPLAKVH